MNRFLAGASDFLQLRAAGGRYVDKTDILSAFEEEGGAVALFLRPRRFGKSLNLSTLAAWWALPIGDPIAWRATRQRAFAGTLAGDAPSAAVAARFCAHPVIQLQWKDCKGGAWLDRSSTEPRIGPSHSNSSMQTELPFSISGLQNLCKPPTYRAKPPQHRVENTDPSGGVEIMRSSPTILMQFTVELNQSVGSGQLSMFHSDERRLAKAPESMVEVFKSIRESSIESHNKEWRASVADIFQRGGLSFIIGKVGNFNHNEQDVTWDNTLGWISSGKNKADATKILYCIQTQKLLIWKRSSVNPNTVAKHLASLLNLTLVNKFTGSEWKISISQHLNYDTFLQKFNLLENITEIELTLRSPNHSNEKQLLEIIGLASSTGGDTFQHIVKGQNGLNKKSAYIEKALQMLQVGLITITVRGQNVSGEKDTVKSSVYSTPFCSQITELDQASFRSGQADFRDRVIDQIVDNDPWIIKSASESGTHPVEQQSQPGGTDPTQSSRELELIPLRQEDGDETKGSP